MLNSADSFNTYGTNSALMLNGLWSQVNGDIVTDPSDATRKAFQTSGNGFNTIQPLANLVATQGMAFRIWAPSLPCNLRIGWFDDTGVAPRLYFTFTASGRVQVYSGDAVGDPGTLLGASASPAITANAFWHIEAKATFSTTVGTIEIKVEGVTVLSLTGLNTGIAQPYNVGWWNNHAVQTYIKDFVQWDSSGSYNNDFLGSVQVYDLFTNSDVALNWAPTGAANGYSILDNVPPDDAKFISAAWPAPSAYEATLTDLPDNISSVKGVILRYRAAKIDGGDGNIQASIKNGSSTQTGANRPITTSQTFYTDVFEVDPATSALWTVDAVNAAHVILNRTT